jgi:hypothetical protein
MRLYIYYTMPEKKVKPENILRGLMAKQIKNIPSSKKLQFTDLKRISKKLSGSIFDPNSCCLWTGYVTNINNISKGIYINFYFNGKKVALHRLLYINFIGELCDDEYIKFTCNHKGKCCNIYHLIKYKYNRAEQIEPVKEVKIATKKNKVVDVKQSSDTEPKSDDFFVEFN